MNLVIYQDADIPNQSVIHAVRGGRWSARASRGKTTPLSKVCLDTVGEEEEDAANGAEGGMEIAICCNFIATWSFEPKLN